MRGRNNLNRRRISSDNITSLSKGEVFVFGSNILGKHNSGAAAYAVQHFKAQWGVGVGPTGQCYAIPTMSGALYILKYHVHEFIRYAEAHQKKIFLVTKIGCDLAGFTVEQVAPLFRPCIKLDNVYLPAEFYNYF